MHTGPLCPRRLMPEVEVKLGGMTDPMHDEMYAEIWVPLDRFGADNYNPIEICCHEMLHIFCNNNHIKDEDDERITRILTPILYVAYCKAFGKKQANIKDIT